MRSRTHPHYLSFAVHRISGLVLAIFLPVHFYMLSLLLTNPEKLDRFLTWTSMPAVTVLEAILVFLACVHLTGGIRILLYESIAVSAGASKWISVVTGFAVAYTFFFLLAG